VCRCCFGAGGCLNGSQEVSACLRSGPPLWMTRGENPGLRTLCLSFNPAVPRENCGRSGEEPFSSPRGSEISIKKGLPTLIYNVSPGEENL